MSNRIFPAGRLSNDPGQVDDSFYALEGIAKNSDISNVTINDFEFFFYFLERLSTPKKAVKNAHFMTASEQLLDYARADVARTPGHKHAHEIISVASARRHPVDPRDPAASMQLISMLLLHRPVVRLATGDCLAPSFAWVCFTFTRPPPVCHNLVNRTSMTMIGTTAEVYSATGLASGRRRDNLITRSRPAPVSSLIRHPASPGRKGASAAFIILFFVLI
jgi:hypothetical protein